MAKKKKEVKMSLGEAIKLARYKVKVSKAVVKGSNDCGIWAIRKMSKNIQIIEALLDYVDNHTSNKIHHTHKRAVEIIDEISDPYDPNMRIK